MKKQLLQGLFIPLFVSAIAFGAFVRTPAAANMRTVDMLALVAVGMGLGVALAHIRILLGMKSKE